MNLNELQLDRLMLTDLWSQMNAGSREAAARALYESEDRDDDAIDADQAIADAIRFRLVAVRRMPVKKRIDYLGRVVRPDEALASKLLRALHLHARSEMLGAFLDAIEIPHEQGVIAEDFDFEANLPDADRLASALGTLDGRYPPADVNLYAATLLAMDPECWGPMEEVLQRRAAAG